MFDTGQSSSLQLIQRCDVLGSSTVREEVEMFDDHPDDAQSVHDRYGQF